MIMYGGRDLQNGLMLPKPVLYSMVTISQEYQPIWASMIFVYQKHANSRRSWHPKLAWKDSATGIIGWVTASVYCSVHSMRFLIPASQIFHSA
ncbi:Uncharacterised protein [Segatella copri]|nr:Uncharacterised protein [Segatella copri]